MKSGKSMDPTPQFLKWFEEAVHSGIKNPEAMTLATATRSGKPSARIVLYKGHNGKGLTFHTNYRSPKGLDLKANPVAAIVFYWPDLDRQVRVEGRIQKLSAEESDTYWNTRPRESRIRSLASQQSKVIPSQETFNRKVLDLERRFEGMEIPRPSHWGGFCLIPKRFEFWTAGDFRLHDRLCYLLKKGHWVKQFLSP